MKHATATLVLALLAHACVNGGGSALEPMDPEAPAMCSEDEATRLWAHRIEPILTDGRPDSCNSCHLTGLDLKDFVRGTPCQSMACLHDKGLVDFENPADSTILRWIERAGANGGPTAKASEAEHAAFEAWIEYSARCQSEACGELEDPCVPLDGGAASADAGVRDPEVDAGPDAAPMPEAPDAAVDLDAAPDAALDVGPDAAPDAAPDMAVDAMVDRSPCGEPATLDLFIETVYAWKGRCEHCHSEGGITAGLRGAPLWLVEAHDEDPECPAARQTMQNIIDFGLVNPADPLNSLILMKPLAERAGGIRHGGGTKFLSLEDPAYLDFKTWVEHHSTCVGGVAPDAGPDPDGGADMGPEPDAAHLPDAAVDPNLDPLVRRYCDCMVVTCHDLYHDIFGEDEERARANCFVVTDALPRAGELVQEGRFLECRLWACNQAEPDPDFCQAAAGGGVCAPRDE